MFSPTRSLTKVRKIMKRRDPEKSKIPSNSEYNELAKAKAKTITLKLQIPVGKKTSMVYDIKGMKRLLRKIIDEHIDIAGSRFSREQLAELIDEYVKFCILDFANVESIPMMSKIKIYLSAR